MEISVFEGANKSELSMIEVAHAILEQRGDVMDFSDLANQIQNYLGKSDSEIRDSLAQFYTDLNIDGSFISLGDNRWGLRSWYAIDSIDEEVNHGMDEEDEDTPRRRKRKKVNAFINDDEDEEIAAYNSDLQEIGADDPTDDEEDLPGNIEEDLSIIDEDDDDEDYEEEEFSDSEKE
ncbi:TPA: DNA-directed RNA polymerase subunit delta [Enterococcus faecium]|uniref:DNA-directed RNA polymerase subunit delta n=1 Tax=Enterococcus faecium TaxID=1352 RepID=UPI000D123C06|nr:DNA-directed RNA polymerase subunit delta [Enterococcus faecium]MCZ1981726.1 DNA-directed RNA polymerase subunit delta [Enterococcus faecium]HAQ0176008.1 DNA-directed RNA polymerase subunit delta [Enterococcus faecium]HAQ2557361.1 DNA-directed RNA polymerase subunit delta [Enterococcus faecium]